MRIKKRFMASFLTLVMLVTALMPNGLVFAADKNLMQETDGFYYMLDYALSEDKTEEVMTLTLQAKENVTIQEVIQPDGEVITYSEQPVNYMVAENGKGNFTVKYIKNEPAEPLETEKTTEAITEEATVTEPQTETSDLAVQETVILFEVTDIPKVETTEVGSETEKDSAAETFSLDSSGNVVVTTLDELNATIANSVDGDTITVDGSITGVAVVNGKKITLTGGTLQALNISNGSEVTLQDITIDANNSHYPVYVNSSTINLRNDTVITNGFSTSVLSKVMGYGGGITATNNSTINMYEGSVIRNNTSNVSFGAGGIALDFSTLIMYGGSILNNKARDFGGGILLNRSEMDVYDGIIDANTAIAGGGMRIMASNVHFYGGTVSNNSALGSKSFSIGGGIDIDTTIYDSDPNIPNSTFTMEGDTEIINNYSEVFGGGVYVGEPFNFYGGTISGNSSDGMGGGIYFELWSGFEILNLSGNATVTGNYANGKSNNLEIGDDSTINLVGEFTGKLGFTKKDPLPKLPNKYTNLVINKGADPSINLVESKMGTNANFFSDNPDYITRIEKDGENNKVVLGFPTITYHLRGGDFTDATEKNFYTTGNQPISKPSGPYYLDHAFVNWYSSADTSDSGTIFDFSTPIAKDTDIYARWYPDVYAISFDANGGTGSMDDIEHNGGANAVDLPANTFTKAGHTFTGWNTAADGTGTPVADGVTGYVAGSNNITLYAQWKVDSFDITFDSKGGSAVGNINDVPYGETITAPSSPTNTGYTFDGWYKDEAYTDAWNFSSDTVLTDITLYAKWTQKEYTVKYDAGFDEFTIADKTGVHYFDTDLVPTPLIKAGYSFGGWKYQDNYLTEATSYADCAKDDTLMEITLVAQWLPIEYTVKYDTKGADTIADKTGVLFDDKNLLPTNPAKTGYNFTGWKLDDVEVTPDMTYSSLVNSDRVMEVTLTAQWELKEYTVKYDAKGADAITDKTGVHFTDKDLLPANPVKAGYTFNGWKLVDTDITADTTYSSLVADDTIMEITLEAQWTANSYTVQYDTKGGNLIANKTGILFTDNGLLPADPIKAGYTFDGWKLVDTDVTVDTTYNSLVADDTVMEITLEAQWTAKEYTVKYDTKGADTITDKIGVHFNDKSLLPADPVKAGYTFDGWKLVDTDITTDTTYSSLVADDTVMEITLEAQWTAKEYTVQYDTQGAGTIADKTGVKYADASLLPADIITKDGYTFLGWKYEDTVVSDANTYESLAKDDTLPSITLVAEWKENVYKVKYDTGFEDVTVADKENVKWNESNLLQQPPKKDGYGFIGWELNDKQISSTDKYSGLTTDQTDGSFITLTAKWTELSDYSVLYNTNGGSMSTDTPSTITGMKYKDAVPTPTPVRDGYTFKGWTYKDSAVQEKSAYSTLAKDDTIKQIELVAQWEENSYTVKYDTKGGNAIDNKTDVKFGDNTLLPTKDPVRAGYTFMGWKYEDTTVVDATRYNELVADDTVKSVILVAQWEINKYTVDFSFTSDKNPDGITVPKEVTVAYGSTTDEPKFTEPTNWTFDGWYTDKECKQKYDFSTPIKGNITLYGKWTYKAPETPKTEEPAKPSEPTKPTTPSTPDSGTDAPKTGDDTNLNLFIALFGISAGLLLLLVGKRKKQHNI